MGKQDKWTFHREENSNGQYIYEKTACLISKLGITNSCKVIYQLSDWQTFFAWMYSYGNFNHWLECTFA